MVAKADKNTYLSVRSHSCTSVTRTEDSGSKLTQVPKIDVFYSENIVRITHILIPSVT